MQTRRVRWVLVGVVIACMAQTARAGQPFAGLDIGAAIPTSDFRKSADIGGAIAPFVGYGIHFSDKMIVSLIGQPQFAAFPNAVNGSSGDTISIFSLTGGPRVSLLDDPVEFFFSAQGGYYWATTGPLGGQDGGFNLAAGMNYDLTPAMGVGIFLRRDQTGIDATATGHPDTTFLVSGLSLRYRFLPPAPPPAVAEAAPPAPAPAPPPAARQTIVLRGVHFDFDKATIRADAKPILDAAVETLKEHRDVQVSVEGYTDSVGTDSYNQRLSQRRAQAVADYLATHGIDRSRLTARGLGESQAVASNATEDGRAQNRRVELHVVGE